MRIAIVGGGPAGLYAALLLKRSDPRREIVVFERNPPDATYGWGLVFSDRSLISLREADHHTFTAISERFVTWDTIEVRYRGEVLRCGGHVFAGIARVALLDALQRRCRDLGVELVFQRELSDPRPDDHDLLISADGVNSTLRRIYERAFRPRVEMGAAKYIWLGSPKVLDSFTFIFRENEHGLFQAHCYPFAGSLSTFIVECDEATWRRAGLDDADEAASLRYCERLLADDLAGEPLLSNASRWISFPTLRTRRWRYRNVVLVGDAAHTAHFSIGSGTRLAMEDAIALANALDRHPDIGRALDEYELERRPIVEAFQQAAAESRTYFEETRRYLVLDPEPFAFQLLTRSGRISYDELRIRDARFVDRVDRAFARSLTLRDTGASATEGRIEARIPAAVPNGAGRAGTLLPPPPALVPGRLGRLTLVNRVAATLIFQIDAADGLPDRGDLARLADAARDGAGLVLTEPVAISETARVTPGSPGLYTPTHAAAWTTCVEDVHRVGSKIGIQIGHAGRRGSTRPRREGLDRALREGGWPTVSASPLAYVRGGAVPVALDRDGMTRIRDDFAAAAKLAREAKFDVLELDMAHGQLLASFLSPLSNQRTDDYGGSMAARARYPLEVLDAVRAAWPADRPLVVSFSPSDDERGGIAPAESVAFARMLKELGCDAVHVMSGQATPAATPPYRRGFLTAWSERVRHEAGVATIVGGYITTADEVNTALAAGRADICVVTPPVSAS